VRYIKFFKSLVCIAFLVVLLSGCSNPTTKPATPIQELQTPIPTLSPTKLPISSPVPTATRSVENHTDGLSEAEVATLSSLEKVDDYPPYTMLYHGPYLARTSSAVEQLVRMRAWVRPDWGCSLFAALGDADNMLYGRNFDWEYSPALLLYTDPPDGYASASMVDLAYMFETSAEVQNLTELPPTERIALLETPAWPFDGVNEMGLVVGMAAVPADGNMQIDPEKETIYSLPMIREMLDHAANVEQAVALLESYNIIFGGPPLHFLLADSTGHSALVEFYQGEMVVTYNEQPWQMATNFLCAPEGGCNKGKCQHLYGSDGLMALQRVERCLHTLQRLGEERSRTTEVQAHESFSAAPERCAIVHGYTRFF